MGFKLREKRQERGLSVRQVSERLGVTADAVRKWETGASMVSLENACRLAEIYRCSVDDLAGRDFAHNAGSRLSYCFMSLNDAGREHVADYAELVFLKPDFRA